MTRTLRKFLGLILLFIFLPSLCAGPGTRPAEALTKKKVIRKVKRAVRKAKKRRIIKKKVRRTARPKKVAARPEPYQLPARSGSVSQTYALEEGVDEAGADNLASELKAIGVNEVNVNAAKNSVQVRFNTRDLSSIGVIKKLKELGYTVKRIN